MGPGSSEPRVGVVAGAVGRCACGAVGCGGVVFRSMSVRVRAVNDFRSGRPGREMKGGLNGTGSGVMCDATSIQQTKLMMTMTLQIVIVDDSPRTPGHRQYLAPHIYTAPHRISASSHQDVSVFSQTQTTAPTPNSEPAGRLTTHRRTALRTIWEC